MLHLQQFSPNPNKEATEQVIEVDIISFLQLYHFHILTLKIYFIWPLPYVYVLLKLDILSCVQE